MTFIESGEQLRISEGTHLHVAHVSVSCFVLFSSRSSDKAKSLVGCACGFIAQIFPQLFHTQSRQ